jgi:hypothetical protein
MSSAPNGDEAHLRRRWYEDPRSLIYVVVEVKSDGGDTRKNSIRALAAVAVTDQAQKIASFQVNLLPLEGSSADKRTLDLYRNHQDAWRVNSTDPQRASVGTMAFANWVKALPGQPALVGWPLSQTAIWLDYYLRRFTPHGVYRGPYMIDPIFFGPGVDLPTLIMGTTGRHYRETPEQLLPQEWFGGLTETHKAKDDAFRHAELLCSVIKLRSGQK